MTAQRELSMAAAAKSGDRATALTALRDKLAAAIDAAQPNELAQLSRQMSAVLAELEQVATPTGGSKSDELRARRAAKRVAGSDVRGVAAVGK